MNWEQSFKYLELISATSHSLGVFTLKGKQEMFAQI